MEALGCPISRLASLNVYFHVPGVARTSWDRTFRLVRVEWEGWANCAEFAALLDAEMRALREHGATRLLADCRRQRVLSPIDRDKAARGAERYSRFSGP